MKNQKESERIKKPAEIQKVTNVMLSAYTRRKVTHIGNVLLPPEVRNHFSGAYMVPCYKSNSPQYGCLFLPESSGGGVISSEVLQGYVDAILAYLHAHYCLVISLMEPRWVTKREYAIGFDQWKWVWEAEEQKWVRPVDFSQKRAALLGVDFETD